MELHTSPPCIQADSKGRKHSPWTGERNRKKTKNADEREEQLLCMISDDEDYNGICEGEILLVSPSHLPA